MLVLNEKVPVVFYDGEQETSLGNVVVSSFLNFKNFQSMLSDKIGISPHQFTIYLTDRTRGASRIPVTAKFNFAAVSGNRGCFFLVVLKRSRRTRRKSGREYWDRVEPPENVIILRRESDEYEKERFLKNMGFGFGSGQGFDYRSGEGVVCEECLKGGSDGEFHRCVRDTVTFDFKSPAGPIAPPVKNFGIE